MTYHNSTITSWEKDKTYKDKKMSPKRGTWKEHRKWVNEKWDESRELKVTGFGSNFSFSHSLF